MRIFRFLSTLVILALISYGIYCFFIQPNFFPEIKLVHMIDPDSLIVSEKGKLQGVQLIGVDAPELTGLAKGRQCGDSESLKKAAELFKSSRLISLSPDGKAGEKDIYGRNLAYVYLEDGTLYNEKLLLAGLAKESNPQNKDYKFRDRFLKAQDDAKAQSAGIWAANGCNGNF
jgi:micrococcal nuclease